MQETEACYRQVPKETSVCKIRTSACSNRSILDQMINKRPRQVVTRLQSWLQMQRTRGLILTSTYTARYLDSELHCGPGLVGLATNIKSSHPKYDLKQPITTNNVKGISINEGQRDHKQIYVDLKLY